jgi:simple sugar transport system substrate-binding protein
MEMKRSTLALGVCFLFLFVTLTLSVTCNRVEAAKKYEIATVVKITGIPWFNRLEEGVKAAAKEFNVNAYQLGPSEADPAQQVKIVEDLIAKGVDAICVVPNDATAMEPVFKKAQSKGIVVLTHESPEQKGSDWDIETIDNVKFGEMHFEKLAQLMGGKGDFALFVGSLTVPLHNFWADVGLEYAKKKYPGMNLVTKRIPCGESAEESYKQTMDLIKAYPNLKGIVGFGSLGPIGASQVLKKKNMCGKIAVVGTVIPSHAAPYLKQGCMNHGFLWDPKDAGFALVAVAKKLLDKEEVKQGTEIKGLGPASVEFDKKLIKFDAILDITSKNADKLGF